MSTEKTWTEEEAQAAMKRDEIQSYVVEDGVVKIQRTMDADMGTDTPDWGKEK